MPHLSRHVSDVWQWRAQYIWKGAFFLEAPSVKTFAMKHPSFKWRQLGESTNRRILKVLYSLIINKVKHRLHVWPLLCLRCATQIEVFAIATEAENIWCSVAGHYSLIRSVLGPGQMFCISSLIKSTINIWFSQTIHWDETFLYTFYIFTTGLCNPENLNTYFYLVVAILEV